MSSSSTSNFSKTKLLIRSVLFLIGLAISYILVIIALSAIPASPDSLFKVLIGNLSKTGGSGQTLRRFREVEVADDIDILFLGSSHSYRSFDPKIFAKLGLKTIHLGTSSQSPLNSYYLLDKYYKKINPKLVIFEMYPIILQLDGLESFYDIIANINLDESVIDMSLAINHMHGYNSLAERYISSLFKPLESYEQSPMPSERYESGGYLHAEISYKHDYFGPNGDIIISDRQLEYLDKIIDFINKKSGKIIIVVAPLPNERIKAITNYKAVSNTLDSFLSKKDILFYDFNNSIKLNTKINFRDHHHLNANGAKVFSYVLMDSLLDVSSLYKTLQIQPNLASDVYTGRSTILMSQNNLTQAESDLHKALKMNSNNMKAILKLGIVLSIKNEFQQAVVCFDKVLDTDSVSFNALYNKASTLEKMENNIEATKYYQKCLEYLPSHLENYRQSILKKINDLK